MDYLSELADFVCGAEPDAAVRDKTALILADTVGAMVGGAAEPEVATLRERLATEAPGPCTIIGTGRTANAGIAALLNGTAGTTLEMDEGNQFAKGHPAIHVIPALLAAEAGREMSGADILDAIAIGYDVAARIGIAAQLRGTMHPHGTWGAIGAAAGVLRLRGARPRQVREAMNIAASLGSTTSRRTMLEGGTVRNVFAGVSNKMGLLTADLAAAGYSGDHDGVAHVFGKVAGDGFDPALVTQALGTRWEVSRNYFKMHSCCRFNHAALDALALIRADVRNLSTDAIEVIEVESYALAAELNEPAPHNVLAAKFSVPFAMATALVNDSTDVTSFTSDKVADPAIRSLAARVRVAEDLAMTAQLPDKRPARVTIRLASGEVLSAETDTNRGDWADPYTPEDLYGKYMSLATRLWTAEKSVSLWHELHALADAERAAPVLDRLGA